MRTLFLSLLSLLWAAPSWAAAGGASSGGGDVVVFPHRGDDQVVLADAYSRDLVKANESEPFEVPENVKNELSRIAYLVNGFEHGAPEQIAAGYEAGTDLISNYVMHPQTEYFFVSEIPKYPECAKRLEYAEIPDGGVLKQVACTRQDKTWVVKDLFRRLSVRRQALSLAHEGMRRAGDRYTDEQIARYTTSLSVALDILNRQLSGKREDLTDAEIAELTAFFKSTAATGKDLQTTRLMKGKLQDYTILRRGGAIVHKDATVDPSAYVGIGMVVDDLGYRWHSYVKAGSDIVHTNFCRRGLSCWLGEGARIINFELANTPGYDYRNPMTESRFALYGRALGKNGELVNSRFVRTDKEVRFATYTSKFWANVKIVDSEVHEGKFVLAMKEGAELRNSTIELGDDVTIEKDAKLLNIRDALLGGQELNVIGFLANILSARITVEEGRTIDLGGKVVCPFGRNEFRPYGGQHVTLRTEHDLIANCSEKKAGE